MSQPAVPKSECSMCKRPASRPGTNGRGECCPCRCHHGQMELPLDEAGTIKVG